MLVDLIHTTCRDGVRLDGCFQPASSSHAHLDAAVCVHGTGSNFYSSMLFDAIGERLLQLGVSVLRINTRGHDLMSTASTPRGGRRAGAAYETLDDCRHDLAAWVDWLTRQNHSRILLIGHSAGALKCLYAAALEPNPTVRAVVAISPPRLSYSHFAASDRAAEFLATYHQAQALVAAGEPESLLDVRFPLPFVACAAGYAEKYGPDERYDYLKFVGRVPCPILVTLGENEVVGNNPAFRAAPAAIASTAPAVAVETVAGADHFYSGVRDHLLARVEAWLASNCPRRENVPS